MTAQWLKAVFLDLHTLSPPSPSNHTYALHPPSSSSSHPSPNFNHTDLVTKFNELLLHDQTSCDVTHLYILTSTADDVSKATEILPPSEGGMQVVVVEAEDRVASFYQAKQHADKQEISRITLMCSARVGKFWRYVCQDLFTPVHEWEVKAVQMTLGNEKLHARSPNGTTGGGCYGVDRHSSVFKACRECATDDDWRTRSSTHDDFNKESSARDSNPESSSRDLNTESSTHDLNTESSTRDPSTESSTRHLRPESSARDLSTEPSTRDSSTGSPTLRSATESPAFPPDPLLPADPSSHDCTATAESVRARIRQFLRTLPSLLGLPEVQRSQGLPGELEGFVHGYSTRRGGVTSQPTLCAMNLVCTDKKRDSLLVVEENRRRLSLVGGFDPQTFHIVKVEHGHRVWTVGEEEQPLKFDALVTNRRGVTIVAAGADCIPLLFADPVAMVVGAAHAGWLGSVERVAECVVATMGEKFGSRPEDIRVSMGPGLRLGCFRVLQEEGRMFSQIHPSCQADSVDPTCHTIDPAGLQGEHLPGLHNHGTRACPADRSQGHPTPRTPAGDEDEDEDVKTRHTVNEEDKKAPGIPVLITQASENGGKMTSPDEDVNDNGRSPNLSSSKHPLEELRVEHIPTEELKPTTRRERKSSRLQWTFVDLQLTNYHVLLQAGVKAEHIDMSTSHCTKCNPDLYFSYERDGFPFGNQIGFICMPSFGKQGADRDGLLLD